MAPGVLWLAGCAVAPRAPDSAGQTLAGRLSVQVEADAQSRARAANASFELQGSPSAGRLDLNSPLGSVMAQARWSPGRAVLVTPEGERSYADLDGLTRDMLGESVPVAALFDWLQGRPWPGAASVANEAPAGPGFHQLGWNVDLSRFDEAWVMARREQPPAVTVRARLDRP